MESVILENIAGLGVGCVLAIVIFFMYRRECKNHREQMQALTEQHNNQLREDRKFMEDRLTKLLEGDQKSRKDNTEALTELITYLKQKNGKTK